MIYINLKEENGPVVVIYGVIAWRKVRIIKERFRCWNKNMTDDEVYSAS